MILQPMRDRILSRVSQYHMSKILLILQEKGQELGFIPLPESNRGINGSRKSEFILSSKVSSYFQQKQPFELFIPRTGATEKN